LANTRRPFANLSLDASPGEKPPGWLLADTTWLPAITSIC
jgi:hypothetical protein